jgi:radical SAM protein with 4Fe4S-binding SPASM domain
MRREGCACALGVHMNVRADGRMFSCFKMEELAGDLRTATFGEVFAGAKQRARPARELPACRECPLATLCGAGCRSENLILSGDGDVPACGPWRVRVLCELLAQDRPDALLWPAHHLLAEAKARGIEAPDDLTPVIPSRALVDARRRR